MHEKKCPNCAKWTNATNGTCDHSGTNINAQEEQEQQERLDNAPEFKFPLMKIYPTDPWYIVFGKRIIHVGQLIYFGTIAFIVWFATVAVG